MVESISITAASLAVGTQKVSRSCRRTTSLHDRDSVVIVRIAAVLLIGLTSGYFFHWIIL
jgi:hypothetical protein